jgi:4-hydroxybutyryl-CoA dehydratase/vinylacetyl-CoA-Delta-isomerase
LIENLILGTNATPLLVESVHGAGSPEAQKAMIERLANLEYKKELAKAIAGIGQP